MNKQNNTKFLMATIAALCLLGAFGSTFAKSFLMKRITRFFEPRQSKILRFSVSRNFT